MATDSPHGESSHLHEMLGLLRIRVIRGINLAIRDVRSSDPYVIIKMGKQKLKTRVIDADINPEWNEDLTLSVVDPNQSIHLCVFDHDLFTRDDEMGEADFDIKPFMDALKMDYASLSDDTVLAKVTPCRQNCLSEESQVVVKDGKIVQHMILRLRNVECGEVELELHWIELPH
ncbi:hypothetical protein Cgig2_000998 [Carnegiea gigantea]|uniref:C2 domain-containing protein n=1 Tax=Carnegiea gigantea TaxID=171969 RepID=A0A9Q1GT45_9CARY|nr:hypothetical protein Cgig2_000998 [Carnegiea gigantea]